MRHDPNDPPLTGRQNPFAITQMDDDYDALAELFLGGESAHTAAATLDKPKVDAGADVEAKPTPGVIADPVETAQSTPPEPNVVRQAKIEALILGHLPGMASPWATQYAGALAEQLNEPVGLIRLVEGELSIEIVAGAESDSETMSLEQAIVHVTSRTSRVLVRVDAVHEPQVVSSKLLDAITVICGADEAAIVSSYRTMKGIAGQRPHGEPARFQAAIMGVDSHDAHRALTHLSRAVRTFLDDELTQAPGVQRVGPVRKTTLCRAPYAGTVEDLLTLIDTANGSGTGVSSVSDDAPAKKPGISPTSPIYQTKRYQPQRQADGPTADHSTIDRSSLSARIHGLHAIESRCPHCDGIELAADEAGRLHLLMQDSSSTVGDLLAVKAWTQSHASILCRAEPLLTESSEPTSLHVFTDQPTAARKLLDTPVHVHLLARADSDGFVCLPLNDPS